MQKSHFYYVWIFVVVCFICSGTVLAQALTTLKIEETGFYAESSRWPLGEISAVSDSLVFINLGRSQLTLWDAKSGGYLKVVDTTLLYAFAETYADTSTDSTLDLFKKSRLQADSVGLKHFIYFDGLQKIPGSNDHLALATFNLKRRTSDIYNWGYLRALVRIDSSLKIVDIIKCQQLRRPDPREEGLELSDRRFAGILSESELVFYEPNRELADTLLHLYSFSDGQFFPTDRFSLLSAKDRVDEVLGSRVVKANDGVNYIISGTHLYAQPSENTQPLVTLIPEELEGHQYFDVDFDSKSGKIVLLSGLPEVQFGYVPIKTLSLYDVKTDKITTLGTYTMSATKAFDVSVHDGVAYVLLYDDRQNRPLLHRVDLREGRAFKM